jgi:hypothetical protein
MQNLDIGTLSRWLARVQDAQGVYLPPKTEMLIGGGSARDILDHVLFGRPLVTRDIDLFLVKGSEVGPFRAKVFFELLEKRGLGKLKTSALRAKKRCNPALPKPERYDYVVGYGAHFFRGSFPILSLTLLHTARDLELNGLLNIDKIYLRVQPGETLEAFCQRLVDSKATYENLAELGFTLDETEGYRAWVESRPELMNWHEMERAPIRHAIRVTRSFAKAGCTELPAEVSERFRKIVALAPKVDDEAEFRRGFIKVFSDRHWAQELNTLARLGVLEHISRELREVALTLGTRFTTSENGAGQFWKARWDTVMATLSQKEQERLNAQMEPAMASSFA